jgi:hypothetical protein
MQYVASYNNSTKILSNIKTLIMNTSVMCVYIYKHVNFF